MLSDFTRDLRYACRSLLRTRGLACAVVLSLALGIGANVVIFSAVDAVLLREVPVGDPDRLVDIYTSDRSGTNPYSNSSYPDYFDLRDSDVFESLAAYVSVSMTLDENGRTELLPGELVSGNYFDVLGVRIPIGRGFAAHENQIESPVRVAVISHALWRRSFDTQPSVVGRTIHLNGNAYTVIGIAPSGFSSVNLGFAADVWVPMPLQPEVDPSSAALRRLRGHGRKFDLRTSRGLSMIGRLPKDGTLAQAASRADVVAHRLQDAYPDSNRNRRFNIAPLGEARGLRVSTRPVLQQLAAAVAIVLLVACVNVASLLLTRAVSRGRELAVRYAIGASQARLVRQWLTESVLLALLGSAGALLVARAGIPLLHAFVIPEAVDLTLNGRVLAFTFLIAIGTGLLFGLAPVFQTLRRDATATLREEGGAVVTGAGAARMRASFVVVQLALSLVLLTGAGLFIRTLYNAYAVDLGYQVDETLVASINLDVRGYTSENGLAVYQQLLSRVEAIPGVIAVGAARMTVLTGGARSTGVSLKGRPLEKDGSNSVGVRANVVSGGYFDAMNIPIVRGRSFLPSDRADSPRVAIVNRSFGARVWPGEDPVGKTFWDENNKLQTVVGIVPDTVYTSPLEGEVRPTFYLLLAQNYEPAVALHVRAAGDPRRLAPAINEAVRQVDSQLVVERPQRLSDVLDRTLGRQRMMATLVGLFAAVTIALALVGLYGVMSHMMTERTAEIGVRLAIGATPASIVRLLMSRGLRLLAIGGVVGLVTAFASTRYVASQLFGVSATDPVTLVGVCGVLAITGIAACAIPARRALRVDPIVALRRG